MSNAPRSARLFAVVAPAAHIIFMLGTGSPVVSPAFAAELISHDLGSWGRLAQATVKTQHQMCGDCVNEIVNRICRDKGIGPVGPAIAICRADPFNIAEGCQYCQTTQLYCDKNCMRE
jgi:hypothetical protein